MTAVEANKWMEANMFPFYPLGDLKVPEDPAAQSTKKSEQND
jgi:hypothetical protein